MAFVVRKSLSIDEAIAGTHRMFTYSLKQTHHWQVSLAIIYIVLKYEFWYPLDSILLQIRMAQLMFTIQCT